MTILLSKIIECRGPGNVTEVNIVTTNVANGGNVPFRMMIGKDSPVRITQGLLQEYPNLRWVEVL